jgi:hypothetical protein
VLLNKLTKVFSANFKLNVARVRGLSFLIHAVLLHRTVNLVILSTCDDGRDVSHESRYRRLQDFFMNARVCYKSIARFQLSRLLKPKEGYTLSMDRTNWRFGRKDINFLVVSVVSVVSVVAGAVAVPLFWTVLPKKTKRGNSNTHQRMALMNRLLSVLPVKDIFVLTMDREFVGKEWLKYLDEKGIAFIARIKMNIQIDAQRADVLAAKILAQHRQDAGRCQSYGLNLFFACKNITCNGARETKLLVLSNRFRGRQALRIYKKRWGIERLFWHLKKKGFDLEATHMTCPPKLDKLFAVLALAFIR